MQKNIKKTILENTHKDNLSFIIIFSSYFVAFINFSFELKISNNYTTPQNGNSHLFLVFHSLCTVSAYIKIKQSVNNTNCLPNFII